MHSEIGQALLRTGPFVLVLLVIAFQVRRGGLDRVALGLRPPSSAARFALWWLGFVVLIAAVEVTFWWFGLLEVSHWHHSLLPSIIRITGMVLLAPIMEEIVFRGIALSWLEKRFGSFHLAVVAQALAFVALHNFAYDNSLAARIGVVQSFVDACLFAYARRHTKSLLTPIAMHVTGNLVATAEMFAL